MKYILNNIKFGHPKLYKHQLNYFNKIFVPGLHLDFSPDSNNKIIITGDLFYNTKYITFDLLTKVKEILQEIPISIEIVGNDYCCKLFNFTHLEKIDFKTNNVSLFQLDKDDKSEIGFNIIENDKIRFVKNDHSPKFIQYEINTIDDLKKVEIDNNFIDLIINSELLENQQNENIIDLFLNNYNFNKIYYTEKTKNEKVVEMDSKNINIRNILINNIEPDLKIEMDEIFVIYDEKKI